MGRRQAMALERQMLGDHVLKGLSFTVPKGNTIGIIGKSGAGKTTVFDLILRLLKPTSGAITVDGVDINTVDLSQWRHRIAYVPQDAFLLNDSDRNNIRFHDQHVSDADVEHAVEAAYLAGFRVRIAEGIGHRTSGSAERGFPVANASASPSPALWRVSRISCFSTKPPAPLMENRRNTSSKPSKA